MSSKILKTLTAFVLSVTVLALPAGNLLAENEAVIKSKDEVVYARLAADGQMNAAYVVNHFEVSKPGLITDHGFYDSVDNLTDTRNLKQNGYSVTFEAPEGNFYYQGNRQTTELPWKFNISYYLNGSPLAAGELAGKSGDLEIRIQTTRNEAVNSVFYDHYLLQISLTLDSNLCSDLKSEGATIANAGQNLVVAHTVMPGKDADISLAAMVHDFEMDGIDISAMPFSMNIDLPDTNNLTSDFNQLTEALSDLNDGVGELADGVDELNSGTIELVDGSADINDGLSELDDHTSDLTDASGQIKDALSFIAESMDQGLTANFNLDEFAQLTDGLTQMSSGLREISGGLSQLHAGFQKAYDVLDPAMQAIPETQISPDQLTSLYENSDPSQHGVLDDLVESYTTAQIAKGTYETIKPAFAAMNENVPALLGGLDTMAENLDLMASGLDDSLAKLDYDDSKNPLEQLSDGLKEMAKNYKDFDSGLNEFMDGLGELAEGYPEFHDGLISLSDGVGELVDGVHELYDGTNQLKDETTDIPDTMQTEIDDLLKEYTGSDFAPVSFTSPLNDHIQLVQFVFKCDGIKQSEADTVIETETAPETIWDRLIALFFGKGN